MSKTTGFSIPGSTQNMTAAFHTQGNDLGSRKCKLPHPHKKEKKKEAVPCSLSSAASEVSSDL